MTLNSKDTSNDPTLPIPPGLDIAAIYQMLRDLRQADDEGRRKILEAVKGLSARLAVSQNHVIALTNEMKIISADAAASRTARLQTEVAEQERERRILQDRIRAVDERLEEKKNLSEGSLNTTGKMKLAANLTYEEREQMEKDEAEAAWKKRKEAVITAVMVTTSVSTVGGVVGALIWFFVFYMNNR